MGSELSFLVLVLNASPLVQLVMATLVIASIVSWTMIFDRAKVLKKARRAADRFEARFWSGGDLGELFHAVDRDHADARTDCHAIARDLRRGGRGRVLVG